MNISTKLLQAAAGSAGGAGLDVDEVFSTFLYEGNDSTQTITNNIDLSGEGGLVWVKLRSTSASHALVDTERGVNKFLSSNTTNAESTDNTVTQFNSNGFAVGNSSYVNYNNATVASWTFRKAPKFFDVVTYSGNSTAGRTVSHNLGSVPGCIFVKSLTDGTEDWCVYHRGIASDAETDCLFLNATDAALDNDSFWNDTAPTSTVFTLGDSTKTNRTGHNFVAYLFAHNNNDGEFGPDSDQDIIKCGSYTGNTSTRPSINLGFEPQFLMIKRTDSADNWYMLDTMRGIVTSAGNDTYLYANTSGAEATVSEVLKVTATGFELEDDFGGWNASGGTYIYMAIRRGPLAAPEDATKVFDVNTRSNNGNSNIYNTGFNVDMSLNTTVDGASNYTMTRITGNDHLKTDTDAAAVTESSGSVKWWDLKSNYLDLATNWWGVNNNAVSWAWKRAPSYFDVVTYTGTGSATTVSHNLGVAPEMMWVRRRNDTANWFVYHSGLTSAAYRLFLNGTNPEGSVSGAFNSTAPTASVFTVGDSGSTNASGEPHIAYLFATAAGVSKVGSFTGTGSDINIDCGFSSGARFILCKRTDSTSPWWVFDTVRGIVAGNDTILELNSTNAEYTSYDFIDPLSSGFTVTGSFSNWNANGASYIFYAIS